MLDAIFSLNTLWWVLLVPYVFCCIGLIIVVLLQKGKGVGFSGAFGAGPGGADAVFGPRSSKSLPQKITYTMAGIFMTLSLLMSMLSGNLGNSQKPSTVEDTGVVPVNNGGSGNSIDDLFNDNAPAATPAAPAEGTAAPATPAAETPAPAATPADAPAAPAAEAPAAPAAEAPAAPAPATEAPAVPAEAPAAPAAH